MKKWLEKVDWIYVIVPLALLGTFWVIAAFAGQWPWQSRWRRKIVRIVRS